MLRDLSLFFSYSLLGDLLMGFNYVVVLPSESRFCTTFLKKLWLG